MICICPTYFMYHRFLKRRWRVIWYSPTSPSEVPWTCLSRFLKSHGEGHLAQEAALLRLSIRQFAAAGRPPAPHCLPPADTYTYIHFLPGNMVQMHACNKLWLSYRVRWLAWCGSWGMVIQILFGHAAGIKSLCFATRGACADTIDYVFDAFPTG